MYSDSAVVYAAVATTHKDSANAVRPSTCSSLLFQPYCYIYRWRTWPCNYVHCKRHKPQARSRNKY